MNETPIFPAFRPMLSGITTRSSGYRYTLLGVRTPTSTRTRIGFLATGLVIVACVCVAIQTFVHVDFETFSIWPASRTPSLHDLPPLYSHYHDRELRLPQQHWNRTEPDGGEKYF